MTELIFQSPVGSPGWRDAEEKKAKEEAEQKAKAAAATLPPASQSVQQRVFQEANALYEQRMAEENAKSLDARRLDEIRPQLETLSQQYVEYFKEPTKFAQKLQATEEQLLKLNTEAEEIEERIKAAQPIPEPPPYQPSSTGGYYSQEYIEKHNAEMKSRL